ncbi:MAG: His-Xaa-Ser system protein HxsD [Elusimicrobia bacterium]|nr:His-Xaa-Ser system protein HxsD [Elusimicrobiota bacterium]MDE2236738.1 His-Xaa-Ser system protein HxsD [Elusimicrobiota bacterium]MDE2425166.1 His-Xaa-Ser system protein HxsD [Elusimicrobiota bacterium]
MRRKTRAVAISIDLSLYPLEAVRAAAYAFTDRSYARLSRSGRRARVALAPKTAQDRLLADDFCNELLHQAVRLQVSRANRTLRELIVTKALVCAQPASRIAQERARRAPTPGRRQTRPPGRKLKKKISRFLAGIEAKGGSDPLGLFVPWEETQVKPG